MKKIICDICGKDAVASVEFDMTTMTTITADLCEEHNAQIKVIIQEFFKRRLSEQKVVVNP